MINWLLTDPFAILALIVLVAALISGRGNDDA